MLGSFLYLWTLEQFGFSWLFIACHEQYALFTYILGTQTWLKDQSVTSSFLAIYLTLLALNLALKTMKIKVHRGSCKVSLYRSARICSWKKSWCLVRHMVNRPNAQLAYEKICLLHPKIVWSSNFSIWKILEILSLYRKSV